MLRNQHDNSRDIEWAPDDLEIEGVDGTSITGPGSNGATIGLVPATRLRVWPHEKTNRPDAPAQAAGPGISDLCGFQSFISDSSTELRKIADYLLHGTNTRLQTASVPGFRTIIMPRSIGQWAEIQVANGTGVWHHGLKSRHTPHHP